MNMYNFFKDRGPLDDSLVDINTDFKSFLERLKGALTSTHMVAYLLDP